MENNDLNVLNLRQGNNNKQYNRLEGTGVRFLRILSVILTILGVIIALIGITNILDANNSHPERMYYGIFSISGAISCFVFSPLCKAIATIAEAAKIYKDKH